MRLLEDLVHGRSLVGGQRVVGFLGHEGVILLFGLVEQGLAALALPTDDAVAVEHIGAVGLLKVAEGVLAHKEAERGILVDAFDELIPVDGLVVDVKTGAQALGNAHDLVINDELHRGDGLRGLELAHAAEDGGVGHRHRVDKARALDEVLRVEAEAVGAGAVGMGANVVAALEEVHADETGEGDLGVGLQRVGALHIHGEQQGRRDDRQAGAEKLEHDDLGKNIWAVTGVFAPAVGRAQGCTGTPYFALRYRISASMCL